MKPSKGFTLIELLVTLALVALVSLAIYGSFASGIRAFQRVAAPSSEEDLQIFFEKFSRDFQNSFYYSGISFEGDSEKVSLPTLIKTDPKLVGDLGIGKTSYFYDPSEKVILRQHQNVSDLYGEREGVSKPLLQNVLSIKFSYYDYDPTEKKYFWAEEWIQEDKKTKNPLAVRLEIEVKGEGEVSRVTHTVQIPINA